MTDVDRLTAECERLMRAMQMTTHALEQGHVALAVPVLLAPLVEAANEVSRLAKLVPAATPVRTARDLETTVWLEQNATVPTTLTIDQLFPED